MGRQKNTVLSRRDSRTSVEFQCSVWFVVISKSLKKVYFLIRGLAIFPPLVELFHLSTCICIYIIITDILNGIALVSLLSIQPIILIV